GNVDEDLEGISRFSASCDFRLVGRSPREPSRDSRSGFSPRDRLARLINPLALSAESPRALLGRDTLARDPGFYRRDRRLVCEFRRKTKSTRPEQRSEKRPRA